MEKYIFKDGEKFKIYKETSSTVVDLDKLDIRYIRDWTNGSEKNKGNHWVEIQAIDSNGTNVALNKPVTAFPSGGSTERPLSRLVDGNTSSDLYTEAAGSGASYMLIDLESEMKISFIKVWHYYSDSRTYRETKTEVSIDGVEWITIFDSEESGTYVENSSGKIYDLSTLSTIIKTYGVEELSSVDATTFINFGMDESLLKLGLLSTTFGTESIKILTYSNNVDYNKKLRLVGTNSKMQILKMNYDFNMIADNITGIKSSLIEFVKDNYLDNIKIIFSLDCGVTWKTIKDSTLVDVNIDLEEDVLEKGLSESEFNNLIQADLDLLYSTKKIRYAICLKERDMDKALSISKLKVLYN